MSTARIFIEKLLFPQFDRSVRRRHMKFFMLALLLGTFVSVVFGAILYLLNTQGRIG